MSLKEFFIQPTVSYQINDKIGIGAGFVYGAGSFSIEKSVPVQDQNGDQGKGTLSGKANGYNVGVFINGTDQLTVGMTYRSKVIVGTDKLADIASPRDYKNTFIYRFGAEQKINDMFTGRCGAYFDTSPVQDGYMTPETPGSDKTGLTPVGVNDLWEV